MKLNKIILVLVLLTNFLFAQYAYNVYPSSSGIIKLKVFKKSDNSLYKSANVNDDKSINLSFNGAVNGNLEIHINIDSQYAMQNPIIAIYDTNFHMLASKHFNDNSTYLDWKIPQSVFKTGTHSYIFAYACNNDKYNFIFFFKTIQITKVFEGLEITQVGAASTSFPNQNKGYVGDEFAFVATLNQPLPSGYEMYISFMGVDNNGYNTGYWGTDYEMPRKDSTTYFYKERIQKAGNSREYKICIKDSNYKDVECKTGIFTVLQKVIPIKINSFSITKTDETNDYVDYEMKIDLSSKPKVVKIETDSGNTYYFLKDGWIQNKPNFVTSMNYSNDYKNWTIDFRIIKSDKNQNKWFKLIVQDERATSADEYVDSMTQYFTVPAKDNSKSSIQIQTDTFTKKLPAKFTFTVTTAYKVDVLKVVSSKGESKTRYRDGYGTFGAIQIEPVDDYHWKVTYDVNTLPSNAKEQDIKLTFYLLTKNLQELSEKSITVNVYKDTSNEDFSDILGFLDKSTVLKNLDLGNQNIRYSPISRAEAALIIYEFLKLKNPNFKLPYDIDLYSNPFADLDKNTNYYEAVITLTNYKGDDNVTVLTTKYGVFNPLDYVSRFQFVKMIIEGLNIPKTNDFSYIQNYSDYAQLGEDAKIYFATAVRNHIIRGDNNRLLPYQPLTIFQALTILDRVKDYSFDVNQNQFNIPQFSQEVGSTLGIIPDYQKYNPDVNPIKITGINAQKEGNCTKLTVSAQLDQNATPYYKWITNFGYFKKVNENNSQVLFCPATKMPSVDYHIKIIGNDGYFNFDEYDLNLSKDSFSYQKNIADNNSTFVKFDLNLNVPENTLQENHLFVINKSGSVYKDNLNIGLEKVSVILSDGNKNYNIDNIHWDNDKIYFIVPSISDFYGKNLIMKVIIGSNDKFKEYDFSNIVYKPVYAINGVVSSDINGNYPKYAYVNGKAVEINNGTFYEVLNNPGDYNVSIDSNYTSEIVKISDKNPVQNVFLSYLPPLPPNEVIDINVSDINGTQDTNNSNEINNSNNQNNEINDTTPSDNNSTTLNENNETKENNTTEHILAFNPVTGEEKEYNSTNEIPKDWMTGKPVIVSVPKGISLISGNIDFHNLKDNHVLIVWSLDPETQEWVAYSPYEKIREKIKANGFKFIDKIDANRAFFVVTNAPTKIITYESIDDINETVDVSNLPKGYSLIGSNNSVMSIDEIRCEDGYVVGGIFKYKNGKWQYVIPSQNRYDFRMIEENEGVLVQCIPQRGEK